MALKRCAQNTDGENIHDYTVNLSLVASLLQSSETAGNLNFLQKKGQLSELEKEPSQLLVKII